MTTIRSGPGPGTDFADYLNQQGYSIMPPTKFGIVLLSEVILTTGPWIPTLASVAAQTELASNAVLAETAFSAPTYPPTFDLLLVPFESGDQPRTAEYWGTQNGLFVANPFHLTSALLSKPAVWAVLAQQTGWLDFEIATSQPGTCSSPDGPREESEQFFAVRCHGSCNVARLIRRSDVCTGDGRAFAFLSKPWR